MLAAAFSMCMGLMRAGPPLTVPAMRPCLQGGILKKTSYSYTAVKAARHGNLGVPAPSWRDPSRAALSLRVKDVREPSLCHVVAKETLDLWAEQGWTLGFWY